MKENGQFKPQDARAARNTFDLKVISDFESAIANVRSGAPAAQAIAEFSRDRVSGALGAVTTYEQYKRAFDSYKIHMGHAVSRVGLPDRYIEHAIEAAEDALLDKQLLPHIFPVKTAHESSPAQKEKPVAIKGAEKFPHLVREYYRISPAALKRIMGGTHEATRIGMSGLGPERTTELLEPSAKKYNNASDLENKEKYGKITSGMDGIAKQFAASLGDVTSSTEYRRRMRELRAGLHEATEMYNNAELNSPSNPYKITVDIVHHELKFCWSDYVADRVRDFYLESLFEKAYPPIAQLEPKKRIFFRK